MLKVNFKDFEAETISTGDEYCELVLIYTDDDDVILYRKGRTIFTVPKESVKEIVMFEPKLFESGAIMLYDNKDEVLSYHSTDIAVFVKRTDKKNYENFYLMWQVLKDHGYIVNICKR